MALDRALSVWRTSSVATALPLLAAVGMGISGYLTYIHLFALQPYCGELAECEVVNSSVYATISGVPVAAVGFLAYTALLALGIVNLRYDGAYRRAIKPAILGLSLAGVLYSAYLTNIEINVLEAICLWCVGSAVTISLILILSIVARVRG